MNSSHRLDVRLPYTSPLAPAERRIGWLHVPKAGKQRNQPCAAPRNPPRRATTLEPTALEAGTSFGTALAHLANASLPEDAAVEDGSSYLQGVDFILARPPSQPRADLPMDLPAHTRLTAGVQSRLTTDRTTAALPVRHLVQGHLLGKSKRIVEQAHLACQQHGLAALREAHLRDDPRADVAQVVLV